MLAIRDGTGLARAAEEGQKLFQAAADHLQRTLTPFATTTAEAPSVVETPAEGPGGDQDDWEEGMEAPPATTLAAETTIPTGFYSQWGEPTAGPTPSGRGKGA